jgi:hypothetical protein
MAPPGKTSEYIRWITTLALGAVVAYYTAQTATERDMAALKATQDSFQGEVLRRLDVLQADIREIRRGDSQR